MASTIPLSDVPGHATTFSSASRSSVRSTAFTVSRDAASGSICQLASVEKPSNR